MKKLVILAMVFGLATAGLVGCSSSTSSTTKTSGTHK